MIKRLLILAIFPAAQVFAACASGFIQIADTLYNPDSTTWSGAIQYKLAYASVSGGVTVNPAQITVNISQGAVSLCLAPGLYTPVIFHQAGSTFQTTTAWSVPVSGGPYTVAAIQGTVILTGGFGPVVLSGTPTAGQVPTATSGTAASWQNAGGGVLQVATTTLTNAQVLALDGTPITLLAAPGAGTMLVPQWMVLQMKGSATYVSDDLNLLFTLGSQTLYTWGVLGPPSVPTYVVTGNIGQGPINGSTALYANQPFAVSADNVVTGSGSGMTITVYYLSLVLP